MNFHFTDMDKEFCFDTANILIPKKDLDRFAVIACDQFTSDPRYWEKVKDYTAGYYSALDLILPEIYLSDDNSAEINRINRNMQRYIEKGVFKEIKDSFVFVNRVQSDGVLRQGIIGKIDLKDFTYTVGSKGKIRSTEKTVIERIPPRADIRRGAKLELPHIMLLFDDSQNAVMNYLDDKKDLLEKLYDFNLFGGAGKISGYRVTGETAEKVKEILMGIEDAQSGLLFCVGDGNHSLAAAKSIYEQSGKESDRYALVEIVNIHSPAINFEPIYRVLFGVNPQAVIDEFVSYCAEKGGKFSHTFRCVYAGGEKRITVNSDFTLPVAALQNFLDTKKADVKIDYIHGIASTEEISVSADDTLGFLFDGIKKEELFGAVIKDGSLPRKTFSLGHALDKRFYLEARRIG